MEEQAAKELVIRAGKELIQSGLIVRTWGNISCRTDHENFVITPSGRAYEMLTPDQIVRCKVADASYEGEIKPSSEKGIHALVYRMHPEANFVIHTHQLMASAVSASGVKKIPAANFELLGEFVPIAAYGLPGTKKLRSGVEHALLNCRSHAVIMAHHGALCYGSSYEEAYSAAQQLEQVCTNSLQIQYEQKSGKKDFTLDTLYRYYAVLNQAQGKLPKEAYQIYSSQRTKDGFVVEEKNEIYHFSDGNLPEYAQIHRVIYLDRQEINYIGQETGSGLLEISAVGKGLRPLLDDFAQIVGRSARCALSSQPKDIVQALQGRLGVVVPGMGAVCCAATRSDKHAVQLVMAKDAMTQIGTCLFEEGENISFFDCALMHFVYTKSYSKKVK